MKGVVLAGGTGSRLLPLTKVTNKHLLPVGREPMIYHPIKKMVEAGIVDILVVTGVEHAGDMIATLGSGKDFGCDLTYRVQDAAGGIAQALALAKGFAMRDRICVLLGDNVFADPLVPWIEEFDKQAFGARVVLKEVPDPERFGVAEVIDGRIISIEEKPAVPKSKLAVTGIYFYDGWVFDLIFKQVPSTRGEMEITDVNNAYLIDERLTYSTMKGFWTDAWTFESLVKANDLVLGQCP